MSDRKAPEPAYLVTIEAADRRIGREGPPTPITAIFRSPAEAAALKAAALDLDCTATVRVWREVCR